MKKFLLIGLSAALCVAVLEVGLRLYGFGHPVLYVPDQAVGYRLKPSQIAMAPIGEFYINDLGLRDRRNLAEYDPNIQRVLVLGDSVTWGGIRINDAGVFTFKVDNELEQAEIINAGVNGFSVYQMTALYREYLQELKPGVIVLYVIPGDFYRPPITDLVRSSPAFPKERPALALTAALSASRIVIASRFDWDWAMPPSPVEAREALDGKARVARNIQAIVELKESLSSGQRLLVVVSPFRDLPENPPLPDDVAIVLERESIELVQLDSPELLAEENFVDHIHLSETGHARVAEKLVEALKPLLKQP
jgi:hypothetical protein